MDETPTTSSPARKGPGSEDKGTKKPRSRFDPKAPHVEFPTIMLTAAVIKDICDSVDFTGFGIIVTTIVSLIYNAAVFVWLFGQGGGLRGKIMKRAAKRYAATLVISFIPFIKILPEASLFVILTYLDRKEKSSEHTGGMYRAMRGKLMKK